MMFLLNRCAIDVRGIKVPEFEMMEEMVDDVNSTDNIMEVE